mmetsp:Transcript_39014/g.76739  ORF Transcript_39014/g.76739 Transcript_39014/m.76739 type:complete len:109 (-) Transcript_39014:66-392(-)
MDRKRRGAKREGQGGREEDVAVCGCSFFPPTKVVSGRSHTEERKSGAARVGRGVYSRVPFRHFFRGGAACVRSRLVLWRLFVAFLIPLIFRQACAYSSVLCMSREGKI